MCQPQASHSSEHIFPRLSFDNLPQSIYIQNQVSAGFVKRRCLPLWTPPLWMPPVNNFNVSHMRYPVNMSEFGYPMMLPHNLVAALQSQNNDLRRTFEIPLQQSMFTSADTHAGRSLFQNVSGTIYNTGYTAGPSLPSMSGPAQTSDTRTVTQGHLEVPLFTNASTTSLSPLFSTFDVNIDNGFKSRSK